jgi:exosortase A-associated hydrolase 1
MVPQVERVVLWGLCDAASSSMMYAHRHPLVCGLVLLNPWVHGVEFSPAVKLSHYYRPLLIGKENWRRMIAGDVELLPALKEFVVSSFKTLLGVFGASAGKSSRHSFVEQMSEGFSRFKYESLIILSEDDMTAHEFSMLVEGDRRWRKLISDSRVTSHTVAGADHTFSAKTWRDQVSRMTIDWVKQR